MKKTTKAFLIGALALVLLLPGTSLAKGIKAGFKIGMNNANLFGEQAKQLEQDIGYELKSKWGFCAGGFIQFNLGKVLAIQPEFQYTMKGARMKEEILGETFKLAVDLSFLEVPVLVKFMIPTPGSVKPSLFVGPSIAIKLSAKTKIEYAGQTDEEDVSDDMEDTEFGLIIGGGLDFGKLMFDVRYSLGLSTLSKYEGEEIKNGVISLKVGFSF
ncbi:MAG: PorT family protein [Candidatus Aminicenantes bacterium]|nr:PorT family protein [Candidatus Aminicenantes bacterium]